MRIEAWLRWLLYAIVAGLLVSGLVWWVMPETAALRAPLLALHGAAAELALPVLGAVAVLHVRESWRRRRNRTSGTLMATCVVLLAVTAWCLYYLGSELLREAVSLLHLVVGALLPFVLALHVVLGARSRPRPGDDRDR